MSKTYDRVFGGLIKPTQHARRTKEAQEGCERIRLQVQLEIGCMRIEQALNIISRKG